MLTNFYLILITNSVTIVLLPLLTIFIFFVIGSYSNLTNHKISSFLGVVSSTLNLIITLILYIGYNFSGTLILQGSSIRVAFDNIALMFIILSALLIFIVTLSIHFNIIKINHLRLTIIVLLLVLLSILNLTFYSTNFILFYIFYESLLIPIFIMILIWGGSKRKGHAAYQFFLYTLIGSLFLLFAMLFLFTYNRNFDFTYITFSEMYLPRDYQIVIWPFIFLSFAIKLPLFPFHLWLPEAHVEAPTGGSIILAGILLKVGGYGILRFLIPLAPEATNYYKEIIYTLCFLGVFYGSYTTIRQEDLKKMIAYSSITHMGLVCAGFISETSEGLLGSFFTMISHGFISAGLFLAIGVLYERYHTRSIIDFKGFGNFMPIFSIVLLLLILANCGMPGTSSFIGELFLFIGIIENNMIVGLSLSIGIIMGAAIAMFLYSRVMDGTLSKIRNYKISDIGLKESHIFIIFILLIIFMGLIPEIMIKPVYNDINKLVLLVNYDSHLNNNSIGLISIFSDTNFYNDILYKKRENFWENFWHNTIFDRIYSSIWEADTHSTKTATTSKIGAMSGLFQDYDINQKSDEQAKSLLLLLFSDDSTPFSDDSTPVGLCEKILTKYPGVASRFNAACYGPYEKMIKLSVREVQYIPPNTTIIIFDYLQLSFLFLCLRILYYLYI